MAITNHERVGKALDLVKQGLVPFVERELKAQHAQAWFEEVKAALGPAQAGLFRDEEAAPWDAASLLAVMWNQWNAVFRTTLGQAERTLVSELRDVRNRWAHQRTFSGDDAYRALDSAARLLGAVSAPEATEVERMKMELLRVRFDEQVRSEKRRSAGTAIESAAAGQLKPWRDVVTPHEDVASGRYQQAEFAADLWQVYRGEGAAEYRDPVEFFRRTFLTDNLRRLLVQAVRRLSGQGGDPVVQLQTNFGGGKTHSMLALYHLFGGADPSSLAGVDAVLAETGLAKLPAARRVVLVGTRLSPGNPQRKPDGTVVRTLWGELAWQLGGRAAYDRLAADDELATSPGDVLRQLFEEHGPCLVLIDEWVAYARQLHDESDLPAGSFETQFTFAQALTESAKAAKGCLVVISLPASDTSHDSPHTRADDVEVGGQRGREALDRLRNVIGRMEAPWKPATAEEGFEIVRRRLFQPLAHPERYKDRDVVARAFAELYGAQPAEFPPECRDADYEKRIRAAYPIHPEIFDRLYGDWSTLINFQRTRGVLRLMAAVIHSLWESGDRNPLILPAHVPIADPRVRPELRRYLSENWDAVLDKDVDGPGSLPLRLDSELSNFGKVHAARRVARTIYLGSAPTAGAAHRGLEDRRIKLGCLLPGESAAVFGDALRRLASTATYLYSDGPRYWYDTQPTVTKLAEDRAEQLLREPDKVRAELERCLRKDLQRKGDFVRVHPLPQGPQDVTDDLEARLVVLGPDHLYGKEGNSAAEVAAKAIFESRGTGPRLYRNTLVFLAADRSRYQDLEQALRKLLAWESILGDKERLDLSPHQVRQATTQRDVAADTVDGRVPEAYQWLLSPGQTTPKGALEWTATALRGGSESLAERASKRLRNEELLLTSFAPTRLRMELDRVPLWRDGRVEIRQLVELFAQYTYLPRLQSPAVLLESIRRGVALLTWEQDGFAYAESWDEEAARYRGLRAGEGVSIVDPFAPGLLVEPSVARKQLDAERAAVAGIPAGPGATAGGAPASSPLSPVSSPEPAGPVPPKRFHGTVSLDPTRVGRDAAQIADEVVSHLAGLVGAKVRVTLEIEAEIPSGAPENVVRTVTENSRTLKFTSQGFERE